MIDNNTMFDPSRIPPQPVHDIGVNKNSYPQVDQVVDNDTTNINDIMSNMNNNNNDEDDDYHYPSNLLIDQPQQPQQSQQSQQSNIQISTVEKQDDSYHSEQLLIFFLTTIFSVCFILYMNHKYIHLNQFIKSSYVVYIILAISISFIDLFIYQIIKSIVL